jgi:tetratricopeptide (TPR) repeat protein
MAAPYRLLSLVLLLSAAATLNGCGGAVARKASYLAKGESYLKEGKLEKARLEFRNALQIAPNDPQVRYENGLIEERLGEYGRAAQLYQSAIDANKDLDDARSHLARLYLFAGETDRALKLVQPGLDTHPDNADLLTTRAAARARLKDLPNALADAERAVKLAPDNEAAVSTLAGLYLSSNRADDAQQLLQSAVARLPATVDLRVVLADFYNTHHQGQKAEGLLTELVRLQPKEGVTRLRLARFYAAANRLDDAERVLREAIKSLPDNAALKLSLVDFLASRRSRDAAERELQAMVAAAPKNYDLQFALGRLYEQGKHPDQAEALYRKIIEATNKKSPGLIARDRLAVLRVQQNDAAGAGKLLAEVLEVSPRDSDALTLRGDLEMARGDAKSAIVDLRSVLRDQPNSIPLLRTLARAYAANGERQLAEDMLRQGIDNNAADTDARSDLASLYLQTDRPQQARTLTADLVRRNAKDPNFQLLEFRAAAAMHDYAGADTAALTVRNEHPELPLGWYLGGLLAEAQNRPDEALRDYDRALAINGAVQEPLEAATKLQLRQKKPEQALARATQIVAKYPDDTYAANLQGELLIGLKRWSEAQTALAAALAKAPQWWLPYRNMAYVKLGQGDSAGAVSTLQAAAVKLNQPEPLMEELATLLQRLGRIGDAMAAYEGILKKNPQSDLAANNLAMLLVATRTDANSLARAKQLASRFATSANPSYLDTDGWVLMRHGENEAALPVLEKASSLAPDAPEIRYHLALAQYGAGQKQNARQNLELAIQSSRNFDSAAEAKATLAQWSKGG